MPPDRRRTPRRITDVRVGDHICSIHADDEQQRAVVLPFLRRGLALHEKVLYIVDARTAEAVLGDLRDDGVDVEEHLAAGDLAVLTRDETYVRDGSFDPVAMIEMLRAATDQAVAEGYAALRVTGEMTWALRGLPGSERLVEYEALLNDFFPGSRALALCQYDRRRFAPEVLLDVVRTHPLVAIGADVFENPYFLPPREVRPAGRAAADLDRWIQGLIDRRREEDALGAATRRSTAMLAAMRDGFSVLDARGVHIDVNPALCALTGFSMEELVGAGPPHPYWPPEELASIESAFASTLAGDGGDFELTFMRKDGTRFPVVVTPSILRGADGEVALAFATVRDDTERRAALEALRSSEAQIRGLFEGVILGIISCRIVLEDGRAVDWVYEVANEAYARVTGLADVVGRRASEVAPGIHERDPLLLEFFGRVATTGMPDSCMQDVTSIGKTLAVSAFSPGPGRFTAILADVSEYGRAETLLRESQAELAEAQRIAHVGNWTWDAATDALTWSDEMYRIFGLEPGDGVPALADLASFEDADTFARRRAAMTRAMETGEPYEAAYDIRRADGAIRHVVARGEPVRGPRGTITGVRGTIADRTESLESEQRLFQAQQMETIGRLAGGIAHDVNNLLAVIVGNAEVARSTDEAADRAAALGEIEEAAARGAVLTRQLLGFTRQQARVLEILDIDRAIDELRTTLMRLVGGAVVLTFEPSARGWHVRADRSQLAQLIVNLVANASDAMPSGGTLLIRTEELDLAGSDLPAPDGLEPGRCIVVTFADTGIGMDEATRDRAFEPFFTTKGVGTGSGLGLPAARGIARSAGGDVVLVETAPGQGSTFALYLPAFDEPAVEQHRPERRPRGGAARRAGSTTILVADDDPGVRRLLVRMLEGGGYTVLAAEDGVEALARLDAHPGDVDLVVSDMVMPNMGGAALCARLAAERPGLPVILVSGYPGEDLRADGTLPPGVGFLAKPYAAADLLAKVRDALGE